MSSSVTQSVASSSSSFTLRPFSPTTLALQKKLANFIDAQYKVWKKLPANKIGQLATPEVLEVVKRESTAFHCNSAGEIDLMWLKKDMPLEALKYPEVAYWSNKAGPGPKHEQEEFVFVHGCDEKVMTTINSSKDHSLIAQFIYPFIDFWNLVEYHILIWIACVFCSGTLCITKPTLIVCESSKLVRIFLENYLVRVYQENLTLVTFTAFLEGQFDLPFLQAMCIITIFIIIWDDLPVSPDDWYQCYGIPVVVQYGPFPEHVAILIPKQHPYRPYHMISLHEEYSELDRWARLIIELARKIVAAAPPTPATAGRKEYLICLRQCIVEEAVRLGLWAGLEAAKRKLKRKEQCFRHYIVKTHNGKVNEKTEGASERKEKKINDGMKGVEARKAIAKRAVGKPNSGERVQWVAESIDSLRRDIEAGRTTQLLACPRTMTHGTLEHAEWLLMVVKEGKDVINSAAGWGQLASPVTAAEIEARAELQDRAGASKAVDNVRERSALEILKKLACHVEKPDRTQCFVATCPHCDHQWLIEELGGRSNHTCPVLRQWVLPILHATWTEQLKQEKEDAAIIAAVDGEDADLESASVTRASFPGILPWEFGESITEDEGWAVAGNSTISKKKKRAKRAGSRTDPLHIRALDEFRGRITRQCFKTEKLVNAAQLLAHPLASCLFEDGKPLPAGEIVFVKLADFLKREEFKQWLVETKGIPRSDIEAAMQGEQTWLASDASLGEPSFTTVLFNQTVTLLKGQKMKVVLPSLSRAEIEAAYMEKIALRSLRPYNYDWETGEDRRR